MNSVVSVTDFYFKYLRSDLVLKDINLEIEKGSFTVIIGPSGAGKTTLCKSITGIIPYYTGGDYAG
ncbi:MAG: ATP-binding cassette domain-containing protein, partial [Acidaminococcaceae bacterium]|nr:ATP-binding cassette domain-containing protein [Acidaminococcaceae bacterium]MBP3264568.1 ATP-binding cassette domain-containing protein [Acidaminococcaceae bacterium]